MSEVNAELLLDVDAALQAASTVGTAFDTALDAAAASFTTTIDGLTNSLQGMLSQLVEQLNDVVTALDDASSSITDAQTLGPGHQENSSGRGGGGESGGGIGAGLLEGFGGAEGLNAAGEALTGGAGKVAASMVPAVAAVGGFTAALGEAVHAGTDLITADERIQDTLGTTADSFNKATFSVAGYTGTVEDLAEKTGTLTSKLDLQSARFAQLLISGGLSKDAAAEQAKSMDLLSASLVALNPTLGDAASLQQRLSRGLARGGPILSRLYGIDVPAAEIKQRALTVATEMGLQANSESAKTIAGLQLAEENLTKTHGDLAKVIADGADKPAIAFRRLKTEVMDAVEHIGEPLVEPFLKLGETVTPILIDIAQLLGSLVQAGLPIVTMLGDVLKVVDPVVHGLTSSKEAVKALEAALLALLGLKVAGWLMGLEESLAAALVPDKALVLGTEELGEAEAATAVETKGLAATMAALAEAELTAGNAFIPLTVGAVGFLEVEKKIKEVSDQLKNEAFGSIGGKPEDIEQSVDAYQKLQNELMNAESLKAAALNPVDKLEYKKIIDGIIAAMNEIGQQNQEQLAQEKQIQNQYGLTQQQIEDFARKHDIALLGNKDFVEQFAAAWQDATDGVNVNDAAIENLSQDAQKQINDIIQALQKLAPTWDEAFKNAGSNATTSSTLAEFQTDTQNFINFIANIIYIAKSGFPDIADQLKSGGEQNMQAAADIAHMIATGDTSSLNGLEANLGTASALNQELQQNGAAAVAGQTPDGLTQHLGGGAINTGPAPYVQTAQDRETAAKNSADAAKKASDDAAKSASDAAKSASDATAAIHDGAQKTLADLKTILDAQVAAEKSTIDMLQGIEDAAIGKLPTFTSLFQQLGAAVSLQGLDKGMQKSLKDTEAFFDNIKDLRARGFSDLAAQLLEEGPVTAGKLAAQAKKASDATLSQLQADSRSLAGLAGQVPNLFGAQDIGTAWAQQYAAQLDLAKPKVQDAAIALAQQALDAATQQFQQGLSGWTPLLAKALTAVNAAVTPQLQMPSDAQVRDYVTALQQRLGPEAAAAGITVQIPAAQIVPVVEGVLTGHVTG